MPQYGPANILGALRGPQPICRAVPEAMNHLALIEDTAVVQNLLSRFDAASDGSTFFDRSNSGPLIGLGRYGKKVAGSGMRRSDCAVFLPTMT